MVFAHPIHLRSLLLAFVIIMVVGCSAQPNGATARRWLQAGGGSSVFVSSLQEFLGAAANSSKTVFLLTGSIDFTGAEVQIWRPGESVTIAAAMPTGGCFRRESACPRLDGRGLSRILNVTAATLSLSGLQLVNGRSSGSGGCLFSSGGSAEVNDVHFSGCVAGGMGGAVRASLRTNCIRQTSQDHL